MWYVSAIFRLPWERTGLSKIPICDYAFFCCLSPKAVLFFKDLSRPQILTPYPVKYLLTDIDFFLSSIMLLSNCSKVCFDCRWRLPPLSNTCRRGLSAFSRTWILTSRVIAAFATRCRHLRGTTKYTSRCRHPLEARRLWWSQKHAKLVFVGVFFNDVLFSKLIWS